MRTPVVTVLGAVMILAVGALTTQPTAQTPVPPLYAYAEPGISPDGSEIAFVSGGDIWTVPAGGGEARLLVSNPATERRPLFSPDGRYLAFMSDRTGDGDVYVLDLPTGAVRRLTWSDGEEQLDGWSADAAWLYFSSTSGDIAGMNDIYRVGAAGGTPMVVSGDRYVNEFHAAAAPDGRHLAIAARGIASSQWWRRGSSHIDRSELWLVDLDAEAVDAYTQLGDRDARQVWPMWTADGRALVYVSDRDGVENLWTRPARADGANRRLTSFADGRVLWPSMAAATGMVAFERDFGIWTLDLASGATTRVSITRRGASPPPPPERRRLTNGFSDLALSPDGQKVAFIARGHLFAASTKDGGDAARVTRDAGLASQPVWSPDSRTVAFAADRGDGQHLYLYDFADQAESRLTTGGATNLSPVFSPDGTSIAYLRDRQQLRVVEVASGEDRVLTDGVLADTVDDPTPVWSPDGRWLALFVVGTRGFTNVELIPADGGTRRPVSFLSNMYTNAIAWSPDASYLLFDTRQRTESGELARVDLTLRTPPFREDLFRDLFNTPARPPGTPGETPPATSEPAAPVGKDDESAEDPDDADPADPFVPEFAGIRQRVSLLPLGLDVRSAVISPDGKTAVVIAAAAGQTNLYSWSLDELASASPVARQLTTTTGGKADVAFTPDGKDVYYLDGGRIRAVTVASRESRAIDVTAELTVDFEDDRLAVFDQAWTLLRDHFYDKDMHGVNWNASRDGYGARAAAASTPDELRRILSLMIGDLNASHLGISGGGGGGSADGRLGLEFDRREYESTGRLRVTTVVPLGPAALTKSMATGDYLLAVNGQTIGAGVNLRELLAGTIDRRVELSVASAPDAEPRVVVVRPASRGTVKSLVYRAWVEANREYVLAASGGRLGYVHMINMSAGALDQLHIDLDTENHARDGVVIDLRNNSGGFVNGYALDVFARTSYLRMSTRALPEAPARAILGQRALERETILVTNQHSLSDAEDFTEGYRALELGSVVGEPTAGWIIYTWNRSLVDGSTLRLPRMRVKDADGRDMELHPRPVDLEVSRPLGEAAATGRDAQLDAAISMLLDQLGRAELPVNVHGGG